MIGYGADAQQAALALRASFDLLSRRLQQRPDEDELTAPQRAALKRLERGGPATAAELARREQIKPPSMAAILAVLLERGLIVGRPDPNDGRRKVLTVSSAGAAFLRERRSGWISILSQILEQHYTQAERAILLEAAPLLERLADHL